MEKIQKRNSSYQVKIDSTYKAKLKKLAELQKRSIRGLVEILIDNELERLK